MPKKKTEAEPMVPTATSDGARMPTILAMCREEITRNILDHFREICNIAGVPFPRRGASAGNALPYVLAQILFEQAAYKDPLILFRKTTREDWNDLTESEYGEMEIQYCIASRLWGEKDEARIPELIAEALLHLDLGKYDDKVTRRMFIRFEADGAHGLFKARIAEHIKANAGFIAKAIEAVIPGTIAHTDGDAAAAELIRASLFDARPRPNPLALDRMRNVHRGIPEYIKERMSEKLWLDMPEAAPADIIRNAILALDPEDSADRFP